MIQKKRKTYMGKSVSPLGCTCTANLRAESKCLSSSHTGRLKTPAMLKALNR